MSHIYNAGYAVVSDTTDPNSVTALQSGHTMKLAVSEDGTTIWKFVEGNPLGEKWVPALPDNVALKDEDETITGTWTFNNVINAPGGTSTEWNTAYDRSITGASFNTSNGVYRITRQDGSNVDTDLDGRWLLFENWDTNNTDIDGLTSGSTFGKLIEGSVAGHFVLGIRSNDDNDAFYILATDNADYTGDYTEKLFEVSKNRIQYKGDNVARQGVNNNFSVGQSIIGSLDVSSNISTTNGFAQFVRNADATTPITLLKLQNQFTGQDVVYDFKLGSSKELIIEGTSASSKIISSQPVEITGTLDVNGDVTISKDNPSIIIDDNLGGRSVSIGLVNNEFRIKDVANNASVFVVDLSQNPTVLDVKAITTFERNVTFDQDIDVTGNLDV